MLPDCTIQKVTRTDIPMQKDDHSCGPLICAIAKCLVMNKTMPQNLEKKDMIQLRLQMKHEIINKKVLDFVVPTSLGELKRFPNPSGTKCWLIQ